MKELSIEEKAKAYDEAIEIARKINNGEDIAAPPDWTTCEVIFPQLKEPKIEDEKIREWLIGYFQQYKIDGMEVVYANDLKVDDIIAWLRKQNKPIEINPSEFDLHLNRLLKQFETLPKEELESSLSFYLNVIQNDGTYKNKKPKFEAGSWITNGEFVWLISNVGDFDYEVISPKGEHVTDTISHVDEYFHLWTIKDAKDGDVLTANIHHWEIGGNIENFPVRVPTIFIYRETKTDNKNVHACVSLFDNTTLNIYKSMYYIDDFGIKNIHPATKEQQELLFLTMQEAGYEWDANEKVPKKIKQKIIDKVEPKFHEGDFVVDNCGYVWKIGGILNQFYILEGVEGGESRPTIEWVNKTFHLWTINDARKGDILQIGECILIFDSLDKDLNGNTVISSWYFSDSTKFYGLGPSQSDLWSIDGVSPATREQCELLFANMEDAGYEWDIEKKEPKKIEEEFQLKKGKFYKCIKSYYYLGGGQYWFDKDKVYFCKMDGYLRSSDNNLINVYDCKDWQSHFCPYPEKSTWSEEDEKIYQSIMDDTVQENQLNSKQTDWLRNIKYRHFSRPTQEWSEKDENMLEKAIKLLDEFGGDRNAGAYTLQQMSCRYCADWLKSLKQRMQ